MATSRSAPRRPPRSPTPDASAACRSRPRRRQHAGGPAARSLYKNVARNRQGPSAGRGRQDLLPDRTSGRQVLAGHEPGDAQNDIAIALTLDNVDGGDENARADTCWWRAGDGLLRHRPDQRRRSGRSTSRCRRACTSSCTPLANFQGQNPVHRARGHERHRRQRHAHGRQRHRLHRPQQAPVIDLAGGFGALRCGEGGALATATASDVYGRQYATYRTSDRPGAWQRPSTRTRGTSRWQHITYVATGLQQVPRAEQRLRGQRQLRAGRVQRGSYGLYQYLGARRQPQPAHRELRQRCALGQGDGGPQHQRHRARRPWSMASWCRQVGRRAGGRSCRTTWMCRHP